MNSKQKELKQHFKCRIEELKMREPLFAQLCSRLSMHGDAYVIGGFLRDTINNEASRDIDIVAHLQGVSLLNIVKGLKCPFTVNRMQGIKIQLEGITVDVWELKNNWAVKNNLVKLNPKYILEGLAKGCFFNYDSLVININTFQYNTHYYNKFLKTEVLDLILKNKQYTEKNPTMAANIIRACYIKNKHTHVRFSDSLKNYISASSNQNSKNAWITSFIEKKKEYPKYDDLDEEKLQEILSSF